MDSRSNRPTPRERLICAAVAGTIPFIAGCLVLAFDLHPAVIAGGMMLGIGVAISLSRQMVSKRLAAARADASH